MKKELTVGDLVKFIKENHIDPNVPIMVDGYEALYDRPENISLNEYVLADDGDGCVYGEYMDIRMKYHEPKDNAVPIKALYIGNMRNSESI